MSPRLPTFAKNKGAKVGHPPYNGTTCDGEKNPATYTGVDRNGVAIHWGDLSLQSLQKLFAQ